MLDKKPDYYLINSKELLSKVIEQVKKHDAIAIDTETTGLDTERCSIVGVSLCCEESEAYYIPIRHVSDFQTIEEAIVINSVKEAVKGKLLVMHNAKFDYKMFQQAGWDIENKIFDTMIADFILNPHARHSLDDCSERELNVTKIKTEDLIGKKEDQRKFDEVPISETCRYACEDAYCTFRLYQIYSKQLSKKPTLSHLFWVIEMPLMRVLTDMERTGVYIDTGFLASLKPDVMNAIRKTEKKIRNKLPTKKAKKEFNFNSTAQMEELLYTTLDLPVLEWTSKGRKATSKLALKKLEEINPIVADISEYKKLNSILRFFNSILQDNPVGRDGRMHGSFNQTVARTGRLSSSKPNLQNIPAVTDEKSKIKSEELGSQIRKAFCAQSSDFSIIAADYSQVELRILAALAKEEKMLKAFRDNEDIHTLTASLIFSEESGIDDKTKRKRAKGINFGISYGMGARTLADRIGSTIEEAQRYINDFYKRYPSILKYKEIRLSEAKEKLVVKTRFGRERPVTQINSSINIIRSREERIAINTPIQGTSADIMKVAMIKIYDKIKDKKDEIKMVLSVHDELVFEVRNDVVDNYKTLIKQEMEEAAPPDIRELARLVVEVKEASSWAEAH